MEMHQLRYFLAVARTGNFSRAAEECHVSQPSLSQQIIKLEEELGERLFERLPRGVALTPAAHVLQPAAVRILHEAEDVRRLILQARGDVRGRVYIGVLPTIAPYFLPPVITEFARRFPRSEVIVQEDTTVRLLAQIDNAEIDMALVSFPVEAPFLAGQPLFDDELLLAMPDGHHLARAAEIPLTDLAGEDFILLREGHCLSDQTEDFCRESAAFCPRVACRSAQMETVLAMIRSGLGISLVPALARNAPSVGGLILRSLTPAIHRSIGLVWRKNRNLCLVARAFRECIEAIRPTGSADGRKPKTSRIRQPVPV